MTDPSTGLMETGHVMSGARLDRKAARIQVSAEERRRTEAARLEHERVRDQIAFERERQQLALKEERRLARGRARTAKRARRQNTRRALTARLTKATPTLGRRAMIGGPILSPMTVAWIGQIGFAHDKLGWPIVGGLVFAAAWELTTAFSGWMFHQARRDGDRGLLFRVATWLFATSAGAMNYWHALDGGSIDHPTPKAVSYGAMSLTGIALWELYSSLIHRKHLRQAGIVPSARPRFGILRWTRYPRITWTAWSLSVRGGIKTVDAAWLAALTEIARRQREKDKRPTVRVTVARFQTFTVPDRKEHVKLFWVKDLSALTVAKSGPETGPEDRSGEPVRRRSGADGETRSADRSGNAVETGPAKRSGTSKRTGPKPRRKTGPKKRTEKRSGTDFADLLARARDLDAAHLADRGKHISADNLRAALHIAKPTALELVRQVRGGHIDVAK